MMRRRGERLAGLSIALLFAFAAPAGAQLVESVKPVQGPQAGANFLNQDPLFWSLPRVVTFEDDSLFGVCRPQTAYAIHVNWQEGIKPLQDLPPQAVRKELSPSPGKCEYSAVADYTYTEAKTYDYYVKVCRDRETVCTPWQSNRATIGQTDFNGELVPDLSFTATESFAGPIAVISDNNRYTTEGGFNATIDWGEPTRSGDMKPQVVGLNGSFVVIGQHAYKTPGPRDVSVTVNRTTPTTTRAAGIRAADPKMTQSFGRTVTIGEQPSCPAGSERAPDGQTCRPACAEGFTRAPDGVNCVPLPPTIGMKVPNTPTLASIVRRGLPISLDIPTELQYGVIVELRRPGGRSPAGRLVASTVLRLPRHSTGMTVMRRWVFRKATRCRLKAGVYGVRIPQRGGFPEVRRQLILRGTTRSC